MSLWRKRAAYALCTLIVLLILTPVMYVQVNKIIYAKRVSDYLTGTMGYTKQEIASVKGVWGIVLPKFFAVVEFSDEPGVEYTYFAHNDVLQISYSITPEGRENGFRESRLKHVEPER
ncbi:hypothetical protein R70723_22810 [Paenibacillus sp. FSL R7-0273]|uniref:DUF3139 domain-containing protein n=1 Tax=Paenibacillus sp. FSL R7-0273 TaxID=1536772 RepID=UPI0004F62507|nr:hypothetical protein R70723_22810 [Paenibacillus sp. FSL R7-0273]OMF88422.1 hypothetical protein BK144_21515 [Paenibacillus sp. FSL R7-0273]